MSRIDELIAQYCPDGVPYRPIGDNAVSLDVVAGATPKSGVAEYWENGTIPWMSSGEVNKVTVTFTDKLITQAAYDNTSTKLVSSGAVVIALAGQGKTRGMVARTRIELCTNQSLASIIPSQSMNSDFLFHFLRSQYRQLREVSSGDGSRGGLNLQIIRSFKIPVPPLGVQREIVRILDEFTQLEAELEAELEARRKQYEHYRDQLLTFPEGGVRWVPMGEALSLRAGKSIQASALSDSQEQSSPYPAFGGNGIRGYAEHFSHDESAVIIGRQGALCGNIQRVSGRFYATEHAVVGSPKAGTLPEFAFHLLTHMDLNQYKTQSAQPGLAVGTLAAVEIPLPPLAEQERIVSVLDKFDALVNDLSVGLPAELAARRKQYEYYRDKLLTFKELAA